MESTRRHSSSLASIARTGFCATPALLTKMVTVPNAFSAASNARVMAARSVTSASIAVALPPLPSISSLSALSRSTRRATSATAAPLSASALANCVPSPDWRRRSPAPRGRTDRKVLKPSWVSRHFRSSCPGLSRASTPLFAAIVKDVDGRDKPGHDEFGSPRHAARMRLTSGQLLAPKAAKSSANGFGNH